ncbi:MAG: acylphosphatase [Bacteroidales bacterium]|nr:acylphosphatase [Bacteroidales bacterium]
MKKSIIIKVSGKVQNVGFRFYTKKTAKDLGVKGYVKNLPDSSVYIEAEAEHYVIEQFVEWCRKGPSWARVDKINIQENDLMNFRDFQIR